MGTDCAPLVADLFLFCYEKDFMLSLSDNNPPDIIEAFNSTSRYLDDLLNIDNPYFDQMVGQIYPTEFQLNKANASDTEAPFLNWFKPSSRSILLTVPRRCFFCGSFLIVMLHVCVCYAVVSVPCSLVVTCWERADLLAVVFVEFCHFPKCGLVHIRIEGEVGVVKLV